MLDIKFIIANQEQIALAIKNKNCDVDLATLLKLHEQRNSIMQSIETLNQQKKSNAAHFETKGKPSDEAIETGKKIKIYLEKLQTEFKELDTSYQQLLLLVPNIYSEDTPVGKDESGNVELKRISEPKAFDFPVKSHIELGEALNLLDLDRGVKTAGFRGYYLKNDLALLHWGLLTLAIQRMVKAGFQPMITPTMVREMALIGSGHFPAGKDEIYQTKDNEESEIKYLAGTSEPALMAYRADEVIDLKELPLKYCGISPCYRREVGSYGKDTKGIYRVHEFFKVEQVVICPADIKTALKYFEEMLTIVTDLLTDLELPHRILQICTGDMGAGKYKMYDVETWMPSRNAYSETHSLSFLTDYQTRRLNIRYKDKKGNNLHPYSLNNTVIASPRILIAILENYQQADGTILVPKILQSFVGKKVIKG